jgi:hypothetical protein
MHPVYTPPTKPRRRQMDKQVETAKALVDGVPTEFIFVADGYVAPNSFQVRRDHLGKELVVTIDVEIQDKRVISKRVLVEDPKGVGQLTLRRVQVREWVAEDLLDLLRHARVQPDGTLRLERISGNEIDEAVEIIRRLVGYAPQVVGGGRS